MRQTTAAAVLDGHWGFGQVVMNQAVEMALERAGNCGVAAITVKNSNHIGRLGSYVERIAEANMIGLLCANSHGAGASVAPWAASPGAWPPIRWRAAGPTVRAAHSCWTLRRAS